MAGQTPGSDSRPTDQDSRDGGTFVAPKGRPSLYKPEFASQAQKLANLGATDQEMADFFEIDVRTVYRWKHDHDEFCQALKSGKDIADDRVERSLYQRAIGYEQDDVKIFMPSGAAEPVYAPFRAKVAPDVTAGIFWLKNRRGDQWRDKQQHDHDHSGRVEVQHDLSKLSVEEARALEAILAKTGGA